MAFKFARGWMGTRCNRYEADLYRRATTRHKDMLCPVIACSRGGAVLLAKAATPLTPSDYDELRKSGGFPPDWDYDPADGDGGCPFERKREDWGRLDGKLVAVDYGNP